MSGLSHRESNESAHGAAAAGSITRCACGVRSRGVPGETGSPDAELVMALGEPELCLLRIQDHGGADDSFGVVPAAISVQARAYDATSASGADHAQYRRSVGVILLNARNELFIGRRTSAEKAVWQMPQGGVGPGESPSWGARRELKEAIGTDQVETIAASPRWLYYDVPDEFAKTAWGGRWKGQRQKWLAMEFCGRDSDIDIGTKHREFSAWRWVPVRDFINLAVSFGSRLYLDVLAEFRAVIRD